MQKLHKKFFQYGYQLLLVVSLQSSCGFNSRMKFDGGETEQVLDVVALLVGVLLPSADVIAVLGFCRL